MDGLFDETINVNVENEVNQPITESEILKCVKLLNNNKALDEDNVDNEHIKSTVYPCSGVRRRCRRHCSSPMFKHLPKTAWPIEAKFYVEPLLEGERKFI